MTTPHIAPSSPHTTRGDGIAPLRGDYIASYDKRLCERPLSPLRAPLQGAIISPHMIRGYVNAPSSPLIARGNVIASQGAM